MEEVVVGDMDLMDELFLAAPGFDFSDFSPLFDICVTNISSEDDRDEPEKVDRVGASPPLRPWLFQPRQQEVEATMKERLRWALERIASLSQSQPGELLAQVRTWCARSGRAPPVAPSAEEVREAMLRAAPARSASNLSCSTSRASAASTSSSSSSSGGSSTNMEVVEVEVARVKDAVKEIEGAELIRVAEAVEEAAWAKAGDETEVEAAMAALRRATREGFWRQQRRRVSGRVTGAGVGGTTTSSIPAHTPGSTTTRIEAG